MKDKDFAKYAQVPADGFKIDQGVQDRIKQFYIDRDVRAQSTRTEFLPLVHDFEVYLRDTEMFEHDSHDLADDNGHVQGVGVGYKGVF